MASGAADALSGRFLNVDDEVAVLTRRSEEFQEHELYTLRRRTWPSHAAAGALHQE